jgi:hypothetical protein
MPLLSEELTALLSLQKRASGNPANRPLFQQLLAQSPQQTPFWQTAMTPSSILRMGHQQALPPLAQHASSFLPQQIQMQMQLQQYEYQQANRQQHLGLLLQLQKQHQNQNQELPKIPHRPTDSMQQLPAQSVPVSTLSVALSECTPPPARAAIVQQVKKPKRPLTAYNIFFRDERARLLDANAATASDDAAADEAQGGKKRKASKVGFEDMAKHVSKMWKAVDEETKAKYLAMAAHDKARYNAEKESYLQGQRNEQDEMQKQLESTVDEATMTKYLSSLGSTKKRTKKPRKKKARTEE